MVHERLVDVVGMMHEDETKRALQSEMVSVGADGGVVSMTKVRCVVPWCPEPSSEVNVMVVVPSESVSGSDHVPPEAVVVAVVLPYVAVMFVPLVLPENVTTVVDAMSLVGDVTEMETVGAGVAGCVAAGAPPPPQPPVPGVSP